MFKFNMIKRAINCATGEIIPAPQIVDACFGQIAVSVVFADDAFAIVSGGTIKVAALSPEKFTDFKAFIDAHADLRGTRETLKVLKDRAAQANADLDIANQAAKALEEQVAQAYEVDGVDLNSIQARDVIQMSTGAFYCVVRTDPCPNGRRITYCDHFGDTGVFVTGSHHKVLAVFPVGNQNFLPDLSRLQEGSIVLLANQTVRRLEKNPQQVDNRTDYPWRIKLEGKQESIYTTAGQYALGASHPLDVVSVIKI